MKRIVLFSIFTVLICLSKGDTGITEKVEPEPVNPKTTVHPIEPTTTAKPITKHTTTQPTTTPTPAPTTPSTPSTTTTTTTTTTTVAPSTTTAAPSTTTKPTPNPKPEIGTWALYYSNSNNTCLIVKMALEMLIHYEMTDKQIGNATIIVPKNANLTGSCDNGNNTQQLILSMGANNSDSITFNFAKNVTLKKFMLTSVEIQVVPTEDVFPMMKSNATITGKHEKEEFLTPLQMSYRCKPQIDYNLTTTNDVLMGKMIVSDLQLEAFHNATGMKFDSAKDCEASETPGIVPIAVGCSLAALIIIVLVAYLIGRRRSQARGYLSM